MATKGWKQPYWQEGNIVTTRLSGKREVVFVGETARDAEEHWIKAVCEFQVQTYGAVDAGAWFVSDALARGYPVAESRRQLEGTRALRPPRLGALNPRGETLPTVTIDTDEANRIMDCQVRTISVAEAHLGILELDTEQGFVPLVINRNVAYLLISELAAFMAAEEVDEVLPSPSNDG